MLLRTASARSLFFILMIPSDFAFLDTPDGACTKTLHRDADFPIYRGAGILKQNMCQWECNASVFSSHVSRMDVYLWRGSSASRKPSPNRLTENTSKKIDSPGQIAIHGALST